MLKHTRGDRNEALIGMSKLMPFPISCVYAKRSLALLRAVPDIVRTTLFGDPNWATNVRWVRLGKARGEHNESGVTQKAEVLGTLGLFRVGPRLCEKSH